MKNIFLDCGTHLCEGLVEFYNKGIIDDSFKVYTFEANPACNVQERIKSIPLDITAYNAAVWVEDGYITFNQENHIKSRSGSPTDGYSDIDGWGSSVSTLDFRHSGYDTQVEVPSINFSRFISELPNDSNIICKMDIEGSEFNVLRLLIKEGTISRIKKIYVEFHERFMPSESAESVRALVEEIKGLGVEVETWF